MFVGEEMEDDSEDNECRFYTWSWLHCFLLDQHCNCFHLFWAFSLLCKEELMSKWANKESHVYNKNIFKFLTFYALFTKVILRWKSPDKQWNLFSSFCDNAFSLCLLSQEVIYSGVFVDILLKKNNKNVLENLIPQIKCFM